MFPIIDRRTLLRFIAPRLLTLLATIAALVGVALILTGCASLVEEEPLVATTTATRHGDVFACGGAGESCCPITVCFPCTGPADPELCCSPGWCAGGTICGGGAPGHCFRCGHAGEPCCFEATTGALSCEAGSRCVQGGGCR